MLKIYTKVQRLINIQRLLSLVLLDDYTQKDLPHIDYN